ncbi:hypothetical protein Tco_0697317, partial [Tanacetum coccineum]
MLKRAATMACAAADGVIGA